MAAKEDNLVSSQHTKIENVFSMKGGKGEGSYANNSQGQARHARAMLHLLKETLDIVHLNSPELPFTVADLGCSSGRNTITTVDFIVDHITNRYKALGNRLPEFSAIFSDLPSNDFNTLFQLLHPAAGNRRSYFAAGVPGSFYHRLFPARSINVFHSVFSLHWLSQVPESVVDGGSVAYNKGKVFIHRGNKAAAAAYRRQFQADLAGFLQSRSEELKKGGAMFVACLGRTSVDPTDQGGAGILFGTHFEDAWEDLVQEGWITSEKRDSFNIPLYAPSLQDFKEVIEANSSFSINMLEVFKGGSPLVVNQPDDATEVGRAMANTCRSVSSALVDAHIGDRLSKKLFTRVEHRATCHAKDLFEKLQFFHIVASLSLA
ncbi:indole-3-acetate O-methyltransferase 1-like [Momordica charantia]|uniref:Indole-3-acetate O-methyltransferase 1-like n=1 Tax=Momordica charantia TaxID=3673 RepID=A0A6J1CDB0_MOMCH|nr:indole-3-acetate O-methyltransferase 1-like [Momordica charantia]